MSADVAFLLGAGFVVACELLLALALLWREKRR